MEDRYKKLDNQGNLWLWRIRPKAELKAEMLGVDPNALPSNLGLPLIVEITDGSVIVQRQVLHINHANNFVEKFLANEDYRRCWAIQNTDANANDEVVEDPIPRHRE